MTFRVGVFGTFDVRNYGDLLFPIVADWRLRDKGFTISAYSPTGNRTGWKDALPSGAVATAFAPKRRIHGVLIGGGNIIHNREVDLIDYRDRDVGATAYSSLWLLPALGAASFDLPIVWNAPGVPARFSAGDVDAFVQPVLDSLSYFSVRDLESARNLGIEQPDVNSLVPDSALEISRVWPAEDLLSDFKRAMGRKGFASDTRIMAVHCKRRSLKDPSDEGVARFVAAIGDVCASHDLVPAFLSLAPCHHDDAFARVLGQNMQAPHIVFDDHVGLKEIASLIAHAAGYLGSSLHGHLTACSYGTFSTLIASPDISKFRGFSDLTGTSSCLSMTWEEGLARTRFAGKKASILPRWQGALDRHWARIELGLRSGKDRRAQRSRLLRRHLLESLASGGAAGVLAPYRPRECSLHYPNRR